MWIFFPFSSRFGIFFLIISLSSQHLVDACIWCYRCFQFSHGVWSVATGQHHVYTQHNNHAERISLNLYKALVFVLQSLCVLDIFYTTRLIEWCTVIWVWNFFTKRFRAKSCRQSWNISPFFFSLTLYWTKLKSQHAISAILDWHTWTESAEVFAGCCSLCQMYRDIFLCLVQK